MKRITNLSGLLSENLKKIYAAERQQLAALTDFKELSCSPELRKAISVYQNKKEHNLDTLKKVFGALNLAPKATRCDVIDSLINNCRLSASDTNEENVADAALISTIQQINHYNISNYGTVASYAKTLNNKYAANLLHTILLGEKEVDEKLSKIAEEVVNPSAVQAW